MQQPNEVLALRAELDQMSARVQSLEMVVLAQNDAVKQTQTTILAMHKTMGQMIDAIAQIGRFAINKPTLSIRKDPTQS